MKASQMDGARPPLALPPSLWKADEATPHSNLCLPALSVRTRDEEGKEVVKLEP